MSFYSGIVNSSTGAILPAPQHSIGDTRIAALVCADKLLPGVRTSLKQGSRQ
jgi:hypothetical protein